MSNSVKANAAKNSPSGDGGIIILAGGLGTRLRSVVSDLPKCMAPVNGKPFLDYVIEYFIQQGIPQFIFSLGYKHEIIIDYLQTRAAHNTQLTFQYSLEDEPLGTGGAIKKACSFVSGKKVFVTNGDTLFKAGVSALNGFHIQKKSVCSLALKSMKNFSRYGVVELNDDESLKSFSEKKYYEEGLINGGLYMLDIENFLSKPLPDKFSFETDYLEKFYKEDKMYGLQQNGYFIDIGIPEDYERASREL